MPNPRGIAQCIRILVLYNTGKRQKEMNHVYLRGARAIKQDLDQYRTAIR
jgi:chorismate mutase